MSQILVVSTFCVSGAGILHGFRRILQYSTWDEEYNVWLPPRRCFCMMDPLATFVNLFLSRMARLRSRWSLYIVLRTLLCQALDEDVVLE
jgi:hypothetical protein